MPKNVPLPPSVLIFEDITSRRISGGSSPAAELVFNILNTSDHLFAEQLLVKVSPLFFGTDQATLRRKDYALDPDGRKKWRGVVQYGPPDSDENEEREQMSFQVSGETVHITQAFETIGKFRKEEEEDPTDYQGAIGVDQDGEVKGCDILTGKLSFTRTAYFPLARVDDAYIKTIAGVVGRVNAKPFKSFEKGEVLLTGCSGSPQWDKERWEITFNFDCSPNVKNLTVGEIKVKEKLGWDYLWVVYEKVEDEEGKQLAARPLQVNVERVYRFANFSALGIGG